MSAPGLIPQAGLDEAEAHQRARALWIAAERKQISRQRAQGIAGFTGLTSKVSQIPVDHDCRLRGNSGSVLFEGYDEGCEGGLEGLNPGQQVMFVNHERLLSGRFVTVRKLVDSGKRNFARWLGRVLG